VAHLHLVSVHPFAGGNGRIARIVQSLVLARAGLLAPEFSSIEEYLARNTTDYYRVLAQVQGGSYQPARNATPWVRFCVAAHIQQARERRDQIAAAAKRWAALVELVESHEVAGSSDGDRHARRLRDAVGDRSGHEAREGRQVAVARVGPAAHDGESSVDGSPPPDA